MIRKRPRMGRPMVPDKAVKRIVVYVRGDQQAQLESAAANWQGSVSRYVRELLCTARVIAR